MIVAITVGGNILYYIAIAILNYRLERKQQDYEQKVPYETLLEREKEIMKLKWEHENSSRQQIQNHEKEMKAMELEHEVLMKKLENEATEKELEDVDINSVHPPTNASGSPKFYS